MGAYFCMGAYKHDVVAVIKMGACIHEVLAYLVWVSIIPISRYSGFIETLRPIVIIIYSNALSSL